MSPDALKPITMGNVNAMSGQMSQRCLEKSSGSRGYSWSKRIGPDPDDQRTSEADGKW